MLGGGRCLSFGCCLGGPGPEGGLGGGGCGMGGVKGRKFWRNLLDNLRCRGAQRLRHKPCGGARGLCGAEGFLRNVYLGTGQLVRRVLTRKSYGPGSTPLEEAGKPDCPRRVSRLQPPGPPSLRGRSLKTHMRSKEIRIIDGTVSALLLQRKIWCVNRLGRSRF